MNKKQTLALMFEANKQALEKELTGLMLPKDVNNRALALRSGALALWRSGS